jgi:uncharacterized protein YxeA
MKHFVYVSIAVITSLIIGGITITAADHTEQSNMAVKQKSYEKVQEKHTQQIQSNTKDIWSLGTTTDMINLKLEAILNAQKELNKQCSSR